MWTVIHYGAELDSSQPKNPHMTFALIALISRLSALVGRWVRYCETLENPYSTRSNYRPYSRLPIPAARIT